MNRLTCALALAAFFLFSSYTIQETTWVAIGDSITYLNDHPDETGNRVTKGYLSRVAEQLPAFHYVNQGHNGWTAVRIAKEMDHLGIPPGDVYTIFLGTNDWWAGLPLGTLEDYQKNTGTGTTYGAFRIILDKIKVIQKSAKIVLITPMQRADFVYINNPNNHAWGSYQEKAGQSLEQFANAVLEIGKLEQIPTVDLYHQRALSVEKLVKFKRLKDPKTGTYQDYPFPDYTHIPFDPNRDDYPYPPAAIGMTYDGLHPSDQGNQIIAKLLVETFRQLN